MPGCAKPVQNVQIKVYTYSVKCIQWMSARSCHRGVLRLGKGAWTITGILNITTIETLPFPVVVPFPPCRWNPATPCRSLSCFALPLQQLLLIRKIDMNPW